MTGTDGVPHEGLANGWAVCTEDETPQILVGRGFYGVERGITITIPGISQRSEEPPFTHWDFGLDTRKRAR